MSEDLTCTANFEWTGEKTGKLNISGKASLPVSVPAEFGGDGSKINPEELLAGSLNACTSLTFLGVLDRAGAPLDAIRGYQAETDGRYGKGESGMEFKEFVIDAQFTVAPGAAEKLRKKVESTEVRCLVEKYLQVPVKLNTKIIES